MDSQALALSSWQHVTLGLALELAVGSAYLLFVALMGRRWRRDILIAAPPVAAFAWMAHVSGGIRAQAGYWSGYLRFVKAHYPVERYPTLVAQTKADYARAVASVAHVGWVGIAVTECVVVLSLLLLRWWMLPRRAVATTPPALEPSDDAGNELEITIEPLGVEGGDVSPSSAAI